MRSVIKLILIFSIVGSVLGCSTQTDKKAEVENEDKSNESKRIPFSELAKLMKTIHKEAVRAKDSIEDGSDILNFSNYGGIYSATPTKENLRDARFNQFAQGYLMTVDSLHDSPKQERKWIYNRMIDQCMTCHASYCPGPSAKIRKLYFPKKDLQ